MSRTVKKAEPGGRRAAGTEFSCRAPHAGVVHLAGTFNAWDPTASPLTRRADGTWAVTLDLPPGRYEYKFVVDGQWCCEPGCDGTYRDCPKCVPNAFGTMNRFVEVSA